MGAREAHTGNKIKERGRSRVDKAEDKAGGRIIGLKMGNDWTNILLSEGASPKEWKRGEWWR